MRRARISMLALAAAIWLAQPVPAQPQTAEEGTTLRAVWHLGRVTGDIDRIVAFYCDLVGLDFRGDRGQPIAFYSVPTINEFVNAPNGAEFRAAFMPIPGASPARADAEQIYLEAFEYRHIDRRLEIPALTDIGVTTLRFIVADVDAALVTLKAGDVAVVTPGGEPVAVPAPPGYGGQARAVLVRDPDGYPVELVEVADANAAAPGGEGVLGAQMTLVVDDLPAALDFFERFIGGSLTTLNETGWMEQTSLGALWGTPSGEHRRAAVVLPGSAVALELIELRGVDQDRYAPVFQDIGFGHVAFETDDIERVTATMDAQGARAIAESGSWTAIGDTVRAVYTRDPNGFFIEVIERR